MHYRWTFIDGSRIDPVAAVEKKATNRKIVGDADVLLFPNIHGANFAYKILTHVAKSIKRQD